MGQPKTMRNLMSSCMRNGIPNLIPGISTSSQGDSLSPLLLIPLRKVMLKTVLGYDLGNRRETVNHLLTMDDLEPFAETAKQQETLVQTVRIFSDVIKMTKRRFAGSNGRCMTDGETLKPTEYGAGYKHP